ncbi:MAG: leucine--tRNA ligase, partial [Simkania negevensis]|nr:leucine--tRNA ligase [Simkania negevensis]
MKKAKYNHLEIEKKWQKIWKEKKLFKATINPTKPKYYILDMFPYPSGAGLHVGHVTGYTATDLLARYKRKKGFNVLHPMGWDSFGLQAEQYLATTDRKYYKWTQWIFGELYKKGLAYEAEILVNYCPALKTVLANEEVENGVSVIGSYPVERRPFRQWVLKITVYAERLLEDLEMLDWPEYLKRLQRNWIGKSEGANIHFLENETRQPINVFTTCPDTLFGVTFLVLAPEHPLVEKITSSSQKEEIKRYQKKCLSKSDLERTDLNKEKSGVWTGAFAVNPANDELLPIWIADYVLINYGTGAVMGVPGGDERDFEFAKKYHLPVIPTYDPFLEEVTEVPEGITKADIRLEILSGKRCWPKGGICINSKSDYLHLNGLSLEAAKEKALSFLEESGKGSKCTTYKLRDWLFSRQRYWGEPIPILHFADGSKRLLELDELPLFLPEVPDYTPSEEGKTPLDNVKDWVEIKDPKTGKKAKRETNTMPQWAGSCWYYLRFCDPQNESKAWDSKAERYWMPVDLYVGGVEHAVLHLLYARFWHKVLFDLGFVSTKEPFQMLRNQGLITAKAYKLKEGGYISPDQVIKKGEKFYEEESLSEVEEVIEKMSKSKLNGVSPDEIIEEHGADSLRLYELFMGPFDKEKLWNSEAISGCRRFLDRFYQLVVSDQVVEEEQIEGMKLVHRLAQGVYDDIEKMQFNTAIAKMMECINNFYTLPSYPKKALEIFCHLLSPFAPHVAEECFFLLTGKTSTLIYEPFPIVDPTYLTVTDVTYIIQVNGKLRGRWDLPLGKTKEELFELVKGDQRLEKYLEKGVIKLVF